MKKKMFLIFISLCKNGKKLILLYRLKVELLVHSEVNANKHGFSGLSPKILFYKHVKWFKTFYEEIKALLN